MQCLILKDASQIKHFFFLFLEGFFWQSKKKELESRPEDLETTFYWYVSIVMDEVRRVVLI